MLYDFSRGFYVHGCKTATSLNCKGENKKEFEGSGTHERSHLRSYMFLPGYYPCCRQYSNFYVKVQQPVTEWDYSPAASGYSMQQCLVCICNLLLCRFCPFGLFNPKSVIQKRRAKCFQSTSSEYGIQFWLGEGKKYGLSSVSL